MHFGNGNGGPGFNSRLKTKSIADGPPVSDLCSCIWGCILSCRLNQHNKG